MDDSMYYTTTSSDSGAGVFGLLVYLAIIVLLLASLWKMYVKAGKPGWAAIVPVYNLIVQLQIIGRPIWWIIMFFIPFVNIVFAVIVASDTSKAFGKGLGTTLLLIFLPFIGYPMLGFGDAKYVGPVAGGGKPAAA